MEAYAAHHFRLFRRDDNGSSHYDQLMSLQRQTGRVPAELRDAPELPAYAAHVWRDFLDLHASRGSTGFGPARITWQDIACWQSVTGARLLPWEVTALLKLDLAYFDSLPKPKSS